MYSRQRINSNPSERTIIKADRTIKLITDKIRECDIESNDLQLFKKKKEKIMIYQQSQKNNSKAKNNSYCYKRLSAYIPSNKQSAFKNQHCSSGYLKPFQGPCRKKSKTLFRKQFQEQQNEKIKQENVGNISVPSLLSPIRIKQKNKNLHSSINMCDKNFYTPCARRKQKKGSINICSNVNLNENSSKKFQDKILRINSMNSQKMFIPLLQQNDQKKENAVIKLRYDNRFSDRTQGRKHCSFLSSPQKTVRSPSFLKKKSKKVPTFEDFLSLKTLGNGKYGKVQLVIHIKSGFICALKSMSKKVIQQENTVKSLIEQIKIQSYLNHPNIVKLFGYFQDQENIYLILEYCPNGTLEELINHQFNVKQSQANKCNKDFKEQNNILEIFLDLFEAVGYMHDQGVLHRDLKPENIVISYGVRKICDFGWSVYASGETRKTFCGTPLYISPELLIGEGYDEKIDIWGLGIICFQLIYGKVPFKMFRATDMKKIIKQDILFEENNKISAELMNLLKKMLEKNTQNRYDMSKILSQRIISHQLCLRKKQYNLVI